MIGKTIDRYKIINKLGEGGMGSVWKAEDTKLNRLVALKTLSPHLAENEEARERFTREAQAASALNHPNITTVHDLLDFEDQHFICMEYIEGKTLREMVEGGRVSVKKAVDIIVQTAEALEAAHEEGILHRDVKSANIMVNEKGRVKVMDFGLAHLEDRSQLTRTGTTMGTLAYSSPEQLTGRLYDERSEIWSLGVVFYELLTGQLPFKSSSEGELVFTILSNEQDKPSRLREDVPESVEMVVARILEKDPAQRYQSLGALISDLDLARSELETTTGPASVVRSKPPFVSAKVRNRLVIACGIAISMLLAYLFLIVPILAKQPVLAILPFENLNPPEDEWFADEITKEIHRRISRIDGIQTIATSSTFDYRDVEVSPAVFGRDLGADYILSATIRWQGEGSSRSHVRIEPELVRTDGGIVEWSPEPFEGNYDAIWGIYSDITIGALHVLGITVERSELDALTRSDTEDLVAYEYYLLGMNSWARKTEEDLHRAIEYFNQALERDSRYALAHTGLANSYDLLTTIGAVDATDGWRHAREEAEKALSIDPTLVEAKTVLADYMISFERDWVNGLAKFRQVSEQNPNYTIGRSWYAMYLGYSGRIEEALEEIIQVITLDPRSATGNHVYGILLYLARRYDDSIAQELYALELNPEHSLSYRVLGCCYSLKGMFPEAIDALNQGYSMSGSPLFLGTKGYAYVLSGKDVEAERVLEELEDLSRQREVFGYECAIVHTALGNHDRAIDYLEDDFREVAFSLIHMKIDPLFDPIRSHPRFIQLIEKMNFPD